MAWHGRHAMDTSVLPGTGRQEEILGEPSPCGCPSVWSSHLSGGYKHKGLTLAMQNLFWKRQTWDEIHLLYTINTMVADGLVMQGTRASAVMVLTELSLNTPVSPAEGFMMKGKKLLLYAWDKQHFNQWNYMIWFLCNNQDRNNGG